MKLNLNKKRSIRNRKKLKKVNLDRYRITVSKSLKNISAQIIDDSSNRTIVSASSNEIFFTPLKFFFSIIYLPYNLFSWSCPLDPTEKIFSVFPSFKIFSK